MRKKKKKNFSSEDLIESLWGKIPQEAHDMIWVEHASQEETEIGEIHHSGKWYSSSAHIYLLLFYYIDL